MRQDVRRFVLVTGFEVALLAASVAVLHRASPLVLGVAVAVTLVETRRLRHAMARTTPPEVAAAAPGTMLVRGSDVARAAGLDADGGDPRARATAVIDVERGEDPDHPYTVWLHDEVRMLVDELAIGATAPLAWVAEGPIGDALLAQPEVTSMVREDLTFLHVRTPSPAVGPHDLHAAAVRALLDAHDQYGDDAPVARG